MLFLDVLEPAALLERLLMLISTSKEPEIPEHEMLTDLVRLMLNYPGTIFEMPSAFRWVTSHPLADKIQEKILKDPNFRPAHLSSIKSEACGEKDAGDSR